jgi:hypothetical protein
MKFGKIYHYKLFLEISIRNSKNTNQGGQIRQRGFLYNLSLFLIRPLGNTSLLDNSPPYEMSKENEILDLKTDVTQNTLLISSNYIRRLSKPTIEQCERKNTPYMFLLHS